MTFNKWNKHSLKGDQHHFFAPSFILCEGLRMENMTLTWRHEGSEQSALSNMSSICPPRWVMGQGALIRQYEGLEIYSSLSVFASLLHCKQLGNDMIDVGVSEQEIFPL